MTYKIGTRLIYTPVGTEDDIKKNRTSILYGLPATIVNILPVATSKQSQFITIRFDNADELPPHLQEMPVTVPQNARALSLVSDNNS